MSTAVQTVQHHGVRVHIHDTGGKVSRCFQQGVFYEQPLLEHIYRMHVHGTALDIGANVGNHTLWLAKVCGLRVHAFEPLQYARLEDNVKLNSLGRRVRIHPIALGDGAGQLHHVGRGRLSPEDWDVRGGIDKAAGNDPGAATTPVVTLDSLHIRGKITVVKIDVEDMEPHVLRGGVQTIMRWRPCIFAEARDAAAHERISAVLRPLDYDMTLRLSGRAAATPMEKWSPR